MTLVIVGLSFFKSCFIHFLNILEAPTYAFKSLNEVKVEWQILLGCLSEINVKLSLKY